MICKNCETSLENEGARFCPKCGAATGDSFSPPAVENDFLSAREDDAFSASDTLSSESEKSISDKDVSADFAVSKEFSADEAEDIVENINENDGIHARADATNERSYAEADAKMSVEPEKSVDIKQINEETSIEAENVGQGSVINDTATKIADTKQSDETNNKASVTEQNTYANSYEQNALGKSKSLKIPDFITRHYVRKAVIYTSIIVVSILIVIFINIFKSAGLAITNQEVRLFFLELIRLGFAILAIYLIFPAARTWLFFIAPTQSRLCRKLAEFGDVGKLLKECDESYKRKLFRHHSRIEVNRKFIILFQPSYVFVAPIEGATRGNMEEITVTRRLAELRHKYKLRLAFSNGSNEKVKMGEGIEGDIALKNIKHFNPNFKVGNPQFFESVFGGLFSYKSESQSNLGGYTAHITRHPKPQPRPVEKPKTKKCPKCSANIEKDSVFCKSCGVNVREL